MAKDGFYLGIDLGGTNVKAGVVDSEGRSRNVNAVSEKTDAERGYEQGLSQICKAGLRAISEAGLRKEDIVAVGVGSPGPMDLKKQIIINPHNLPGWENRALAKDVGEKLGLKSVLQNDANAAAFGEFWVGVGREFNSLVQFTLGTGIGCGIVIDGRVLEGEHSHGGEAGHIRIATDGARLNGTGLYGSLEGYAGAKGIVERTYSALASGQTSSLAGLAIERQHRGDVPFMERPSRYLEPKDIFTHALTGDSLAMRIVDETAYFLACGAVTLMHVIDPDIVVFSGGLIETGTWFLDKIRQQVQFNALTVPATQTRIDYASLGTNAGWIGAAGCAKTKFG